jgi:ferredoxin
MALTIDWTRCDRHGLCATLLPGQITLDDWGFPLITNPGHEHPNSDQRRAALACPALALRLEPSR